MEGDGLALPSGLSHATEHSVRDLLFMYGEFTRLKFGLSELFIILPC